MGKKKKKLKNTRTGTVVGASACTNQIAVNVARVVSAAYEFLYTTCDGKAVSNLYRCNVGSRGGVEDTRLEAKAKDTKKNPRPRPRTAFPRTDTLEAKDRNARGQGQRPRTQAQVLSKK